MANQVVFKYGTREQYDGLATKAANALYFLTDTGEIYRGDVNLARGSHYEGERNKVDDVWETDLEVISRVFASISTPEVVDDIFVIKTPIGETGKYSYSSFVYDGTNWCAMDGNYDATNVIFDSNLTVTENIGAFEIPSGQNSAELLSAGKSLKWVLENILAQELRPVRESSPAVTNTVKANGSTIRSYEVGTKVTPSWVASLSAGSYTYGPATGITATSWEISDTKSNTATTASGSFPEFVIADGENYKITAKANYGDGAVPVTNLGNPTSDDTVQFKAGSASATGSAITGFRPYFYGPVNAKLIDDSGAVLTDSITSAMIRGLTNANTQYNASKTMTIKAADDGSTASFIVAYPAAVNRNGVSKAEIQGSVAIAVTSSYKLADATVEVEGKDGYTTTKPYKVWVYSPAQISAGETHSVTLA